jgi:hypothetical protein
LTPHFFFLDLIGRGYVGTDFEIWIKNQEASRLPLDKDIDLSTELISDLTWCIIPMFSIIIRNIYFLYRMHWSISDTQYHHCPI